VAAHRKSRRFRSWTVSVLFFTKMSSIVCDILAFNACISVEGAKCGGSLSSLSGPVYKESNLCLAGEGAEADLRDWQVEAQPLRLRNNPCLRSDSLTFWRDLISSPTTLTERLRWQNERDSMHTYNHHLLRWRRTGPIAFPNSAATDAPRSAVSVQDTD
jgi:hypothetical protein